MDIDTIKQIVELINQTDITELQVEKEGEKLLIKRETKTYSQAMPQKIEVVEAKARDGEPSASPEKENTHQVASPIVGTLYRAPSPDAPNFVEVGNNVKKGQVLCIIEAMKLMNEIECEVDGVIKKIFVENGQPVQYGETLFTIELL
jgi:acetyl-CoA carboxylase biotin carboxyl carrier protein